MKKNLIGVLDSGVGGLSVLKELKLAMPNQNFIYFGDTKNMPYGTKTPWEIFKYTKNIIDFFIEKGVKTVVFACNTTSAVAYSELRQCYSDDIKIFPLIQSVAKDAIKGLENNEIIAILATKATINSKKYEEEIKKVNKNINVVGIECSGFVEIVENRLYDDINSIKLIKEKLEIVKSNNAKRVILGCTHYPYLESIFKNILNIEYFNPAYCLANLVKKELREEFRQESKNPTVEFFVSSNPERFRLSAKTFFDITNNVNLIEF